MSVAIHRPSESAGRRYDSVRSAAPRNRVTYDPAAVARIDQLRELVRSHVSNATRRPRAARFIEVMHPGSAATILDIGADDGAFWMRFVAPEVRRDWRIFACDVVAVSPCEAITASFVADARSLPLPDLSVDIAFSNSVLEHVGDLPFQRQYAREIQRVAKRYFVEVPNKHFPIEPHFYLPFLQYLPVLWQNAVTRWLFGRWEEVHLPDYARVRLLFPTARIERERLFGLTKAFYVWEDRSDPMP